jgi:hypothetical protein
MTQAGTDLRDKRRFFPFTGLGVRGGRVSKNF